MYDQNTLGHIFKYVSEKKSTMPSWTALFHQQRNTQKEMHMPEAWWKQMQYKIHKPGEV